MAVTKSILGMNARNFLYIRKYNSLEAKRCADDKLATKKMLLERNIPTAQLIAAFYNRDDIRSFHWDLPSTGFVIKPARGYGGGGIVAIKEWRKSEQVLPGIITNFEETFKKNKVLKTIITHASQDSTMKIGTSVIGELYSQLQLESHLLDILDGGYSLQFLPDNAFIEERLIPDSFFKKLGSVGIPDVRIIVFQHVPVMAMVRLPNNESHGKANLEIGAIALGIDLRTGITTHATYHNSLIDHLPATKMKVSGIKIPFWDDMLLLASRAQAAVGLGYAGVDIVIDAKRGPVVLEINSRPGLKIQNANLASLRTRLERVEGMDVPTPERGVELAKSLFAEKFAEKVHAYPKILPVIHPVIIKHNGVEISIQAKLDTGAIRSSIDIGLTKELGLYIKEEKILVKSASGQGLRPVAHITFELAGKKITTTASVIDRSHLTYPMIVGRLDLKGFLIKPEVDGTDEDENGSES